MKLASMRLCFVLDDEMLQRCLHRCSGEPDGELENVFDAFAYMLHIELVAFVFLTKGIFARWSLCLFQKHTYGASPPCNFCGGEGWYHRG